MAIAAGCGDETTNPTGPCQSAADLQTCLPTWSEFSPLATEQTPTATTESAPEEVNTQLERIDEDGELMQLGDVTFVCTDRTYSFSDNPEKALSFNIDQTVIWPGALIQGRSHRDGAGSLLELTIRERAPISVSLSFNNNNNTRLVDRPDNSSVGQALGEMIGNAEAEGLATANNITFTQETYSSEQQAAIAFGVSGKYFGFEASAEGSVTNSMSTNIVAARFEQQMYIASATQPSSPAAFFSADFTGDVLAQFSDQLSPQNPPLYVSRVGYGRMMVFTMSAKAEASEIKGALELAYRNVGSSAKAELSSKQQEILQSAEIRISQVGGDQGNALAAIASGNLEQYFQDTAPLTSAAPLWFELKSLTGEVALVSEPGTYTETTCVPKLPGTFDYADEQRATIPFQSGTQRSTHKADINGDNRMDLVFNERRTSPAVNRVHVALAGDRGTYSIQEPFEHSENPAEGWENYDLHIADIDGDGKDDLVWNALTDGVNAMYSARSTDAGAFVELPRIERAGGGWDNYTARAGDLDGDGSDDMLWVFPGNDVVRTYYALAQEDGTLGSISNPIDRAGGFALYDVVLLDQFDGRNGLDVAINALTGTSNNTYIGIITPVSDTEISIAWQLARSSGGGWGPYAARSGNVDGQDGADMIWVDSRPAAGRTYTAVNDGFGVLATESIVFDDGATAGFNVTQPFVADFNDDGRADVLLNSRTASDNRLLTGFGLSDGSFSFPAGVQIHPRVPNEGWEPFDDIFVGDVDGDGRADVVWTAPSGDARIYVAIAR